MPKRPKQLEEWCLADFVSELEITKTNCETNRNDSEDDMEANGQSDDDSDLDMENQIQYSYASEKWDTYKKREREK